MSNETERSSMVMGESKVREQRTVLVDYTNHRGERAVRAILPTGEMFWAATEWHPEEQWLFEGIDVERGCARTFAAKGIHQWGATPGPAGQTLDGMIVAQLKRSMERNARMANRLTRLAGSVPLGVIAVQAAIKAILNDEDPV